MTTSPTLKFVLLTSVLAPLFAFGAAGQQPAPPQGAGEYKLTVETNEVPVRVIVRDRQGRLVQGLTMDDFRVLDDGKPQVITEFSTEGLAPAASPVAPTPEARPAAPPGAAAPPAITTVPNRFVALYFDDLVMDFESIVRTRDAVSKYLKNSLQPGDRVAIFHSSGRGNLDFTADRDKLQDALSHLHPNGLFNKIGVDCPDLSDYEAYLIDERNDPIALGIATQKVIDCRCNGDAQHCPDPAGEAKSAARRFWAEAQDQAVYSLRGLGELVRRLSVLPGQRSVVFVSTGFISDAQLQMISDVIDRAVRVGVVVNALDARGLYVVIPGGDASQRSSNLTGALAGQLLQIQMEGKQRDSDVLAEMADGTGGTFFHNNNDFDAGLRVTGGLPQFSYVLGFSPGKLKFDGKYHHLKVQLVGEAEGRGLKVQARQGYFAPRNAPSSAKAEHKELEAVVFSRDEINGSRVKVGTSFYKSASMEAQVSVRVHLDPEWLTFQKKSDRNLDDVTFVTVIFDNNGKYLDGTQKTVEMHLREATLEKVRTAGVSVESNFHVPPGTYLVREVVRDAGGLIASRSSTLEIPY